MAGNRWYMSAQGFVAAVTIFILSSIGLRSLTDTDLELYGYLILCTILSLGYLWYWRSSSKAPCSWRLGALVIILATILTPSIHETDQYRYIWDGLMSNIGINPYRYAPRDAPFFSELTWTQHINHPHLPTIYPPAAQGLFALASRLNPYFWWNYFSPGSGPGLTALWQVELGWKILTSFAAGAFIWCFRRHRWDLVALNPLFLTKVVGNAHIDTWMALFATFAISLPLSLRSDRMQGLWLTAAILTKWLPMFWLPFVGLRWLRRGKWDSALSLGALCSAIAAAAIYLFYRGSNGNMFVSTVTYGHDWYFFGYIHRLVTDLITLTGLSRDPVQTAKLPMLLIGLAWGLVVGLAFLRRTVSLRLSVLLITLGMLAVSPTLHPWYMILLVPLGLPYWRTLISPMLWTCLALASHSFYIHWSDPTMVRYLVYSVLTLALTRDIVRLRTRLWPARLRKESPHGNRTPVSASTMEPFYSEK